MIDEPRSRNGIMRPRHLPLALLLLAGCEEPECCAIEPPRFDLWVLDEQSNVVPDTRVTLQYSDPVPADTSTVNSLGFVHFYPDLGTIRVTVTPPAGYAASDSSSTDTTMVMDSGGVYLAIVLKRTRR
jgi:hypothetical protein